jgi:hypothetical protein
MYLTDTDVELSWTIPGDNFFDRLILKSDFDIVKVGPDGISDYLVDPLDELTWIPPIYYGGEGPTDGYASWTFNDARAGTFQIHFVSGTADDYQILHTEQLHTRCVPPYTVITDLTAQAVRWNDPGCINPL